MFNHDGNINFESLYLYILSRLPVRKLEVFERWRQAAGSFEKIYYSSEKSLSDFGFGSELIIKLRHIKQEWTIEKLVNLMTGSYVKTITYYEPLYPSLLKEIHDAPPVLFYRGAFIDNEACVAIVGTRKMSTYGLTMMPKIAQPLINAGVTIVSGLAYGIDSAAHAESVKRQARTIAVLGTSVDDESIYPRGHLRLAHQILDNGGLILSEHPPKTPGLKQHFVARNRIIAGLSLGVVVLECKTKSGALLTADYAADFNRNLYAVPGPAYSSLSDGPHQLIKNGATLTCDGQEILDDLEISLEQSSTLQSNQQLQFNELELRVLECMKESPLSIDEISQHVGLGSAELNQTITMLEIKNAIRNVNGNLYTKA